MGVRRQGRVLAFQALYAWEHSNSQALPLYDFPWYERSEMPEQERAQGLAFARLLVGGTLERINEIDELIRRQLDHWDFARISKVDLSILRISVYALVYESSIPPSVTIDEAIVLAKEFGSSDSYRFVNGVLDGIHKAAEHTEA